MTDSVPHERDAPEPPATHDAATPAVTSHETPSRDAPWLEDAESWSTFSTPAKTLRPGMFCFVPSRQCFLRIAAVTHLTGDEPLVFVDLSDGRTLALHPAEPVYVRTPRA